MTIVSIFMASLIMGFSGAIMPGPLLTVTINQSLIKGAASGPKLVLGHAILEFTLFLAILLGLGPFFTWPIVKGLIGILGGLFLIWMAYGILRESFDKNVSLDLTAHVQGKSLNPIVAGVTVSASNPYWSLWWATAGASSLMMASSQGIGGSISFYLGHILSDFIWYSFVACAVAKGKRLFTPLIYRIILFVCGMFLLGLAVYFVVSGIRVV